MINFDYTRNRKHHLISNHESIFELYHSIQNTSSLNNSDQKIFVWSGFGDKIPVGLFNNTNWQQNFVGLFSDQEMWPWKFKYSKTESDQMGNQTLIDSLNSNESNLIASLRIRGFESEDSFQGSLEWFEKITPYLNSHYVESMLLIEQIIQSMRSAKNAGINLLLEKISLIANPNPNNSITLSPHLHRDGAYGYLESAVVSFYSERITPNASTLFFPDFDFERAQHLKPITAEILNNNFLSTSAYSLASGSLAVFSGKLAKDGSKSDSRGALHMSPEGFFPTCRLVLLFRSSILY